MISFERAAKYAPSVMCDFYLQLELMKISFYSNPYCYKMIAIKIHSEKVAAKVHICEFQKGHIPLVVITGVAMSVAFSLVQSMLFEDSKSGSRPWIINTLRPRQNGQHFPDNIFQCIFVNDSVWILNTSWLKFVHRGPIDNNTALVHIMVGRQTGDKSLSEPMTA